MSIIPTITEQVIRTFVGEQNFLKGQHYVRDGAIVNPVQQGMQTLSHYLSYHDEDGALGRVVKEKYDD
jgi:hypothetical protein